MFGPHVNRDLAPPGGRPGLAAHVRAAAAQAAAAGVQMGAFQVFVGGPRRLKLTLGGAEADELAAYVAETGARGLAHGTYLDVLWSGKPYVERFVRAELAACARAGLEGLVLHLGTTPPETVVDRLRELVDRAPLPEGPRVVLETPAARPENAHYATPQALAELFDGIRTEADPGLAHFGLCVDTAHLWACGVDVSGAEAAAAWLADLDAAADVIPPERVVLHLNDNRFPRGGGRDTHDAVGGGQIWGGRADRPRACGAAAFVEWAETHGAPVIFERKPPALLAQDYEYLAALGAARPPN